MPPTFSVNSIDGVNIKSLLHKNNAQKVYSQNLDGTMMKKNHGNIINNYVPQYTIPVRWNTSHMFFKGFNY